MLSTFLSWLQDNACFYPIFIVCLNNYVQDSESKEQPSSKHNKHNKVQAANVPKTETHYHNCVINHTTIIQNFHPDDAAIPTKTETLGR